MTSVDELTQNLKQNPSLDVLEASLTKYSELPTPSTVHQLQVVSTILKHTVPETFNLVPKHIQDLIAECLLSAVGLGNVISTIQMLVQQNAQTDPSTINPYTRLLGRILRPGLLNSMLKKWSSSISTHKEVDKLLFRGRCFSILREAHMTFKDLYIPHICSDVSAYITYLSKEIVLINGSVETSILNSFIHSLLTITTNSIHHFFEVMLSPENSGVLSNCISSMKRFERKSMIMKALNYLQGSVLKKFTSIEPHFLTAIYSILKHIFDCKVWDPIMLSQVTSRYSYQVSQLAVLLSRSAFDDSNFASFLDKGLQEWGNEALMKEEPIVKQGFRTHLLLCLAALCPPTVLQEMTKRPSFLTSVTNRLNSSSERAKSFGVYFADQMCTLAQQDKIFSIESSRLGVTLPEPIREVYDLDLDEAWEVVSTPTIEESNTEDDLLALEKKLGPISLNTKEKSPVDENMSDEEDDPTISSRPRVLPPLYVRDILSYLSVDTKDQDAYEKRRSALTTAPTLLRQKKSFGTEVAFFAEDLLSILTGLTNYFDEKDFESLKLNAIIAVIVSCPSVTGHLCHLLLTGDYSLQQRMCLLSAMSLSCRELKGYRDEIVSSSYKESSFPTQQLPPQLHEQYLALQQKSSPYEDYGYKKLEGRIQNQVMHDASENAKDELAGGKILRISASLKKKEHTSTEDGIIPLSKDAQDSFKKTVGKTFFFPLVAVWYQSGGFDIGPYTATLVSHFIKTLSLILHASYPTAVNLNEMITEYCVLLAQIVPAVPQDQISLIESIATGALIILDILDESMLVSQLNNQISIIEDRFMGIWEAIIDERVKSLCAGLLLRVNELREKHERLLMDQMNRGFY